MNYYIDESGNLGNDKNLFYIGFVKILNERIFENFENESKALLGMPNIYGKCFHASKDHEKNKREKFFKLIKKYDNCFEFYFAENDKSNLKKGEENDFYYSLVSKLFEKEFAYRKKKLKKDYFYFSQWREENEEEYVKRAFNKKLREYFEQKKILNEAFEITEAEIISNIKDTSNRKEKRRFEKIIKKYSKMKSKKRKIDVNTELKNSKIENIKTVASQDYKNYFGLQLADYLLWFFQRMENGTKNVGINAYLYELELKGTKIL